MLEVVTLLQLTVCEIAWQSSGKIGAVLNTVMYNLRDVPDFHQLHDFGFSGSTFSWLITGRKVGL